MEKSLTSALLCMYFAERRFAAQIAVHDRICATKMIYEAVINGDPQRQTPLSTQSSRNSDGPGGRATTRILSPSFGALVFDPKPTFWTLRHVFHSIISISQPGLMYLSLILSKVIRKALELASTTFPQQMEIKMG